MRSAFPKSRMADFVRHLARFRSPIGSSDLWDPSQLRRNPNRKRRHCNRLLSRKSTPILKLSRAERFVSFEVGAQCAGDFDGVG